MVGSKRTSTRRAVSDGHVDGDGTGRDSDEAQPLLIYIRHGDDDHSSGQRSRYPTHDPPLTPNGEARAARMAESMMLRYGVPSLIYCSPFHRARQTADIMVKIIGTRAAESRRSSRRHDDADRSTESDDDTSPHAAGKATIVIDPGLSRFFSRREQRNPGIGTDTRSITTLPVYERGKEFTRRCYDQYDRIVARHYFHTSDGRPRSRQPIVWCVTHALVIRRVAERARVRVPDEHVPFMGWFAVRPRSQNAAMRGLALHGLGRICPERALQAIGPLSSMAQLQPPHDKGKRERQRQRHRRSRHSGPNDGTVCSDTKEREERQRRRRERKRERERKRKAKTEARRERKRRERERKSDQPEPERDRRGKGGAKRRRDEQRDQDDEQTTEPSIPSFSHLIAMDVRGDDDDDDHGDKHDRLRSKNRREGRRKKTDGHRRGGAPAFQFHLEATRPRHKSRKHHRRH